MLEVTSNPFATKLKFPLDITMWMIFTQESIGIKKEGGVAKTCEAEEGEESGTLCIGERNWCWYCTEGGGEGPKVVKGWWARVEW
jgi:hypothetical protein